MSGLSTHVLDTARGLPAAGVEVILEIEDGGYRELARTRTDGDGRVAALLPSGEPLRAANYRLTFATGDHFRALGVESFYPRAVVEFTVRDPARHHHVPLLLSPFAYTTYRGS